ncbi:hypothetical protein EXIGLDRAFT_303531 [Exidia glandulosa HHB12029]|uniref:Uncharacterized protein n=1 Tax=Exidia glandulosa HHB12029 TaxID=1314781 RepID=A0A165ZLU5_EXIGL|nr:hypothetical protein EXIGLDRAFT_303531 [Exidia glandulosa HHB12029]
MSRERERESRALPCLVFTSGVFSAYLSVANVLRPQMSRRRADKNPVHNIILIDNTDSGYILQAATDHRFFRRALCITRPSGNATRATSSGLALSNLARQTCPLGLSTKRTMASPAPKRDASRTTSPDVYGTKNRSSRGGGSESCMLASENVACTVEALASASPLLKSYAIRSVLFSCAMPNSFLANANVSVADEPGNATSAVMGNTRECGMCKTVLSSVPVHVSGVTMYHSNTTNTIPNIPDPMNLVPISDCDRSLNL